MKNKKIKLSIGIGIIFSLAIIGISKFNFFNSSKEKQAPILYLKNEKYYMKPLNGEEKELDDIKEILTISPDGKTYYINTENQICYYDKSFSKNILDIEDFNITKNISIQNSLNFEHMAFQLNPIEELIGNSNPLLNCSPIYLKENNELIKISTNGEIKTITNEGDLFYSEENKLLLYDKNKKTIQLSENFKDYVWNEVFKKLIFTQQKNDILELNIWSADQGVKKIAEFKGLLKNLDKQSLIFLNENEIIFSIFNFKGSTRDLFKCDFQGNLKTIENDIEYVSKINNNDTNLNKINNIIKKNIINNSDTIIYENFERSYYKNDIKGTVGISYDKLSIKDENVYTYINKNIGINGKIILENVDYIINDSLENDYIYLIKDNNLGLLNLKNQKYQILK